MADKRPKLETFTTPKCPSIFPKLNTPDTKWKAEGEYGVKLVLANDHPLLKKLEAAADKALADAKAEIAEKIAEATGSKKGELKKKLEKLSRADLPCKAEYDEDGNETDNVIVNVKMKAKYKNRKSGEMVDIAPKIFDASGKMLKNPPEIWGGSVLKVSGQLVPFYNPATDTAGVSLRLSAVQIIELVTRGSGGTADSFGFGKEDGYEAEEDEATKAGFSDETESGSEEANDSDDF